MNIAHEQATKALMQWFRHHWEPCYCTFCKQGRGYLMEMASSAEARSSDPSTKLHWYVVYMYQLTKRLEEELNGIRQQEAP